MVDVPDPLDDPGNKNRHRWFANYLAVQAPDAWYMTADSRDTVFQVDPSLPLRIIGPAFSQVLLSAESVTVEADPWNTRDQERLQAELRADQASPDWSHARVMNGGFVAGPAGQLAWFEMTRCALDARRGVATDQASLTALARWLAGWPGVAVLGDDVPFVFHGHWALKSQHACVDDQGVARLKQDGTAFRCFHQFDRTSAKQLLLKRYG